MGVDNFNDQIKAVQELIDFLRHHRNISSPQQEMLETLEKLNCFLAACSSQDNCLSKERHEAPTGATEFERNQFEAPFPVPSEASLEDRMQELTTLLDQVRDAIYITDLNGRITFWNQAAANVYGWANDEALGKQYKELLHDQADFPQLKEVVKRLSAGEGWTGELQQKGKSGEVVTVDSQWVPLCNKSGQLKSFLCINTDITEKKKLEEQLFRSQRIDSIGKLAAGIAHDINNLLYPILIAIETLRAKLSDEEMQTFLGLLKVNTERGIALVNQILSFAKGFDGAKTTFQPKYIIREISEILKETLPKSTQLKTTIADELWTIDGDATQISQVLINLCVNARDAMPDGGLLTIKAENIFISKKINGKSGRFVLITVTDTGTGISGDILDDIFTPFFTTKGRDKGTGLGLSTVLEIVNRHGGFIDINSQVGSGTEFKTYIPISESELTNEEEPVESALPNGDGEMILIVEAEVTMRLAIKVALEALSYKIITAANATEAINLYAQNRDTIKAVVADFSLQDTDSVETLWALQKIDPQVRIIVTSGLNPPEAPVEAAGTEVVKAFLRRPYTMEELSKALKETLKLSP
jgi:PAS domain S-box-containing protein